MLTLILILLLTTLAIALFLYVGALYLQGLYYTQASETLFWGAPAAALGLGCFFFVWCLLVARSPGASPENIPYSTGFGFSPRVDMFKEPAKEITAVKKNGDKMLYKRQRIDQTRYVYRDTLPKPGPWNGRDVEKLTIDVKGETVEFKLVPRLKDDPYPYREFVSDTGWTIVEFEDGPAGPPQAILAGRFLMNVFLNLFHLGLWFMVLWTLIRFQWAHALGLAICLWLVFSLAILPMILTQAAILAPPLAS